MRMNLVLLFIMMLKLVASFALTQGLPSKTMRLHQRQISPLHSTSLLAKPKRGAIVDSYRTVSVICANPKCQERLFRYKKKNGTKSNLIKCYVERISEDSAGVLSKAREDIGEDKELPMGYAFECPNCKTQFARSAQIHGLPALKMVGGKVKMTKK